MTLLTTLFGLLIIPGYTLGLVYALSTYYPTACDPSQTNAYVSGSNVLILGLLPGALMALLLLVVDHCREHNVRHCNRCCAATPLWCMALPNFATSLVLLTLASVELSRAGCLRGAWRSNGVLGCLIGEWLLSALTMGAVLLIHCLRPDAAAGPRYQELAL